jgi:HAD superfamily hydrolase (TIGR01509 family)
VEAICFDWDGTLVDSLDTFYRANAAVMAELGLPFDRATYRRHYAPDWRVLYGRLGIPPAGLDDAHERWRRHFSPAGSTLFPGTREALASLVRAGRRLGVVTATIRAVVEPQLAELGIDELVPVRVFGDDLAVHKPDPAPLRLALERFGLPDRAGLVAYVGDAPDDMRMARRAGVRAIGIESMLSDRPGLLAAGADEVHASVAAWVASFAREEPEGARVPGEGPAGTMPGPREGPSRDVAGGGP